MNPRLLPPLGWLVLVGAVALIIAWTPHEEDASDDVGQREIHYALRQGQELAVRLLAQEERVRILAHLETPTPDVRDENQTWLYGMEVSVEPANGPAVTREHWTRSRRTLLAHEQQALDSERPGTILTDSRILEMQVGHLLPEGGLLRIKPRLDMPEQRLLLRIFRERRADALEQTRIMNTPEKHDKRLVGVYPFPWENLYPEEQLRVSGWVRERLATEVNTGESVSVYRHGSPSLAPTAPWSGYRLDQGDSTAVNLTGPVRLTADVVLETPLPGQTETRVPLVPELVDASPRPFRGVDLRPYTLDIPDGALWSLRYHNPWGSPPVLLRLTVTPPAGHAWGEPPGAGGEQPQAPEQRRLTAFHIDKGLPPIVVPVATGGPFGSLAVEARPRPTAEWLANPATAAPTSPVIVSYVSWDEDDRVLGSGSFPVQFRHAPFERYVEQADTRMSEETDIHVFHSHRAARLGFTATGPVDLRFLVPLEEEAVQAPRYEVPEGFTAKYAPWELSPYLSIAPANLQDLVASGRLVRFDATVRIEPRGDGGGPREVNRRTRVVSPVGTPPRYPLMERYISAFSDWQSWMRTRLAAVTTLQIPRGAPLEVDYRVPASQVGQTVFLRCGRMEAKDLIIATGGTLEFRNLEPGTVTCNLNAPPGDYLARVPGSGERWVRRAVFRADGAPLTAQVPVRRGRVTQVYVRTYTPQWTQRPTLEILVDGGSPRRHNGPSVQLTRGRRLIQPEPADTDPRLEDQDRGNLASWAGVRIPLGDDLAPGLHEITLRPVFPEGQPSWPVWARFESTDALAPAEVPENWTEETTCDFAEMAE